MKDRYIMNIDDLGPCCLGGTINPMNQAMWHKASNPHASIPFPFPRSEKGFSD